MSNIPRIVVVGSANTDFVLRVPELPAGGETVLGDSFQVVRGGKGANQAVAAARLGGDVTFVARLGADAFGDQAIAAYREARRKSNHPGEGIVSVMVHTFIGDDVEKVREKVRVPFSNYLKSSFDLIKIAPWAFPAFKQPSKAALH